MVQYASILINTCMLFNTSIIILWDLDRCRYVNYNVMKKKLVYVYIYAFFFRRSLGYYLLREILEQKWKDSNKKCCYRTVSLHFSCLNRIYLFTCTGQSCSFISNLRIIFFCNESNSMVGISRSGNVGRWLMEEKLHLYLSKNSHKMYTD